MQIKQTSRPCASIGTQKQVTKKEETKKDFGDKDWSPPRKRGRQGAIEVDRKKER